MALVPHNGSAVSAPSSNDSMSAGDDFPMLCETCLGPNPYLRMVKLAPGAKLCSITGKAFQAFRWKPAGGRQKETVLSFAIAKDRNLCQACLNDMKYGVPAGVRDKLEAAESAGLIRQTPDGLMLTENGERSDSAIAMTLQSLKKTQATAQIQGRVAFRNLAKLCSFWVAGTCTRVVNGTCPFRPCCGSFSFPELAGGNADIQELGRVLINKLKAVGPMEVMKSLDQETRDALANHRKGRNTEEAIRSRVDGSDELTSKYINKENRKKLAAGVGEPPDGDVCTLWLGGVEADVTEEELNSELLKRAGEMKGLRMVPAAKCAFVSYATQEGAIEASNTLFNTLEVKGKLLQIRWAKPKTSRPRPSGRGSSSSSSEAPPAKKKRA